MIVFNIGLSVEVKEEQGPMTLGAGFHECRGEIYKQQICGVNRSFTIGSMCSKYNTDDEKTKFYASCIAVLYCVSNTHHII